MLEQEFILNPFAEEIDKYNMIATAHAKNNDTLIVSLFPMDQWDMIISTATSLDITAEDIVRELSPNEVIQYEISSNDWNEFFIQNGLIGNNDLLEDGGDNFSLN